jgi:hypothetical protein
LEEETTDEMEVAEETYEEGEKKETNVHIVLLLLNNEYRKVYKYGKRKFLY